MSLPSKQLVTKRTPNGRFKMVNGDYLLPKSDHSFFSKIIGDDEMDLVFVVSKTSTVQFSSSRVTQGGKRQFFMVQMVFWDPVQFYAAQSIGVTFICLPFWWVIQIVRPAFPTALICQTSWKGSLEESSECLTASWTLQTSSLQNQRNFSQMDIRVTDAVWTHSWTGDPVCLFTGRTRDDQKTISSWFPIALDWMRSLQRMYASTSSSQAILWKI